MNKSDSTTEGYKVIIVEDHLMFREHLVQLVNRDMGMAVCGEVDNVIDAMKLIVEKKPDIAIVDITLRGSSGLELLKDIKAQGLVVNVLVLSMHDEDLFAERALRAGARGYITKNEASTEVVKAIREIMLGKVYASRKFTSKLLAKLSRPKSDPPPFGVATLADRELEVFQMLGRGRNTQEIAHSLNLGITTVETYRTRIRQKLQLRSSADLYLRAGEWVKQNGG